MPIKKIIGVVTGSRAEYFLLRWIMEGIRDSENLELQVFVTGMHLSPEFGLTYSDINKDGFRIDRKVEMLLSSDTPSSVSKSMGLAMIGFADAFEQLQPDLIIVLGDRFEILAASATAMIACIPILHIHGGETTEGAVDEAIRHSITKMAHFHFVAAKEYRQRVIQLGEHPERVFQVGGLGIDCINKLKLLDLVTLESSLDFKLGPKNLLVTFHPVTLEKGTSEKHMNELLASLEILKDTHLIFTMPNSDTDGRILFKMIEEFVVRHTNAKAFTSLGQLRYFSCIKHFDGVIGNSSSGLCEVPSFKKGTINIGDRQKGRLKAESIIDCEPEKTSIINAIQELYSPSFQTKLTTVKNPYGSGGASVSIVKFLEEIGLDFKLKKNFFNLKQK
jgi:GDP/UDP-N,N'-diacetylbacillosamine 2-epimerase (hydrolysing)